MSDQVGGTLVLGALGLGLGLLAVDHYYSRKGHSALDALTRKVAHTFSTRGAYTYVGADDSWTTEVASLPPFAQTVIQKAIASETDPKQLTVLAKNLEAAGFKQAAAAVRAAKPGASGAPAKAPGS